MKKSIALFLSIVLLLGLCGCGNHTAAPASSGNEDSQNTSLNTSAEIVSEESEKKLGIIYCEVEDDGLEENMLDSVCTQAGISSDSYSEIATSYCNSPMDAAACTFNLLDTECTDVLFVMYDEEYITVADDMTKEYPDISFYTVTIEKPVKQQHEQIDWLEKDYTYKDDNGYEYLISIKISPWILQSYTDVLNSAWESVGKNNSLPTFDDWNISKTGENTYQFMDSVNNCSFRAKGLSAFYYAVGSISISNVTTGWDFSESNTGTPKLTLMSSKHHSSDSVGFLQDAHILSKIFYGSKVETHASFMHIDALMKSNNWGPVPFVLAYAENFSPAYPDGEYKTELENLDLTFANAYTFKFDGAEDFHIQIYDEQP